jgi:hypothetical protein
VPILYGSIWGGSREDSPAQSVLLHDYVPASCRVSFRSAQFQVQGLLWDRCRFYKLRWEKVVCANHPRSRPVEKLHGRGEGSRSGGRSTLGKHPPRALCRGATAPWEAAPKSASRREVELSAAGYSGLLICACTIELSFPECKHEDRLLILGQAAPPSDCP